MLFDGLSWISPPEFMVYSLVTLHLWVRIFKMFPELRGLSYSDDGTTIGRLSQDLKLARKADALSTSRFTSTTDQEDYK